MVHQCPGGIAAAGYVAKRAHNSVSRPTGVLEDSEYELVGLQAEGATRWQFRVRKIRIRRYRSHHGPHVSLLDEALFHLSAAQVIAASGVLFVFQGLRLGTGLCGRLLLADLFVDICQPLQRRGERGFAMGGFLGWRGVGP